LALEKELGKKRILELYFNIIYFGNGTYGIGEAAHFYFNKSVPDLTLNQMVILISVISAPTAGNPIQHPEVFVSLRDKTVEIFTREDAPFISAAEKEDILSRSASCLDPELRKPDSFTQTFSQTVPLSNERYGPFAPGKREGDVF
jgi:membrane carboxypeptidase/penicillin-binding protein